MNRKTLLTILLGLVCGCTLIGCGYGTYAVAGIVNDLKGNTVTHGFEFNAHTDSLDIEILNYEYSTRKPDRDQLLGVGGNRVPQGSHISGGFPRGDFVYMKWRVRSTGQVFEDRVDLRTRITGSIKDKKIYCVIDGGQLYILLIPFDYFRQKVTSEELKRSQAEATTPVKRVLNSRILYRVQQIYPDPAVQLQ
jgi:hypothetical protein